jgi:tripartite-type tricarboxylate transporter receptor subunit TctC
MMSAGISRRRVVAGIAGAALAPSASTRAAPAGDFYRGKTLTTIVGFAPGGGVDTAARVVARHLSRFIPGSPRSVVQNLEGAAGIVAALSGAEVATMMRELKVSATPQVVAGYKRLGAPP